MEERVVRWREGRRRSQDRGVVCGDGKEYSAGRWGPSQAVSPERDPGTCGSPCPELKPLSWDNLRPEPGSSAAYVCGAFEEPRKARPLSWGEF